jgi:hypothetical protein
MSPASLDPTILAQTQATREEDWRIPFDEGEEDVVRALLLESGLDVPPCLERRAEDRPTDPDFRTVRQ